MPSCPSQHWGCDRGSADRLQAPILTCLRKPGCMQCRLHNSARDVMQSSFSHCVLTCVVRVGEPPLKAVDQDWAAALVARADQDIVDLEVHPMVVPVFEGSQGLQAAASRCSGCSMRQAWPHNPSGLPAWCAGHSRGSTPQQRGAVVPPPMPCSRPMQPCRALRLVWPCRAC